MNSKQILIETSKLKTGLYIAALDRPWSEVPCFEPGFWLEEEEQVKKLQELCQKVFVDVERSKLRLTIKKPKVPDFQLVQEDSLDKVKLVKEQEKAKNIALCENYIPLIKFNAEVPSAQALHREITLALDHALDDITSGHPTDLVSLKLLAARLVTSIQRNADVITLMTRIADPLSNMHNTAIRVAIWSVMFGLQVNKDTETLNSLSLSGLLCKIGYIKTEKSIANLKEQQHTSKHRELNSNLHESLMELKNIDGMDGRVIQSLRYYLERFDGSGHPGNLAGSKIPLSTQILGLAEYYERLVSADFTKESMSPTKAISHLHTLRGIQFTERAIDQFTHMLGVYPTGTLVSLSNDDVAIVTEQKFKQRLKPNVTVIGNIRTGAKTQFEPIDLSENNYRCITSSLPSNSFQCDLTQLVNVAKPWWQKFISKIAIERVN